MASVDNALGRRLRALREALGLSQQELAAEVSHRLRERRDWHRLHHTYLSKIENGHNVPSANILLLLAQELNTDANELLLLAGRPPEKLAALLAGSPGARAFWRTAAAFQPTELQWEVLTELISGPPRPRGLFSTPPEVSGNRA